MADARSDLAVGSTPVSLDTQSMPGKPKGGKETLPLDQLISGPIDGLISRPPDRNATLPVEIDELISGPIDDLISRSLDSSFLADPEDSLISRPVDKVSKPRDEISENTHSRHWSLLQLAGLPGALQPGAGDGFGDGFGDGDGGGALAGVLNDCVCDHGP